MLRLRERPLASTIALTNSGGSARISGRCAGPQQRPWLATRTRHIQSARLSFCGAACRSTLRRSLGRPIRCQRSDGRGPVVVVSRLYSVSRQDTSNHRVAPGRRRSAEKTLRLDILTGSSWFEGSRVTQRVLRALDAQFSSSVAQPGGLEAVTLQIVSHRIAFEASCPYSNDITGPSSRSPCLCCVNPAYVITAASPLCSMPSLNHGSPQHRTCFVSCRSSTRRSNRDGVGRYPTTCGRAEVVCICRSSSRSLQ